MINAIKFAIEEIEASDQYFDHTGTARYFVLTFALLADQAQSSGPSGKAISANASLLPR